MMTTATALSRIERESSFTMILPDKNLFTNLAATRHRRRDDHLVAQPEPGCLREELVLYFRNGDRFSGGRYERKTVVASEHGIIFFNGNMLPVTRSVSTETLCSIPNTLSVSQIVARIVLVEKTIEGQTEPRIVRFRGCIQKETARYTETQNAIRYTLRTEIEYSEKHNLHALEDRLARETFALIDALQLDGPNFDPMDIQNLYNCSSAKLVLWDEIPLSRQTLWAYKWNGLKAKLTLLRVVSRRCARVVVWPDNHNLVECEIFSHTADPDWKLFDAVCWQIEIMSEAIVFVEPLSRFYNQVAHQFDARSVSPLLSYFAASLPRDLTIRPCGEEAQRWGFLKPSLTLATRPKSMIGKTRFATSSQSRRLTPLSITHSRLHEKQKLDRNKRLSEDGCPVIVQRYRRGQIPSTYDRDRYDGFVFIQHGIKGKFKMPSVDVRCYAKNHYTVGGDANTSPTILIIDDPNGNELDAIYEIGPDFKIIKRREDRSVHSSQLELARFIRSVKNLASCNVVLGCSSAV